MNYRMIVVIEFIGISLATLMTLAQGWSFEEVIINFIGLNVVGGGIALFLIILYKLMCWALDEDS